MQEIEKQIRLYGQTRNITDLQTYISRLETDEIKLIIKKRVSNIDFLTFWNYLLQGLDTEDSQEKRYDIITTCINEIKERDINTPRANSIITRLCMELSKLSTKELVSLCVMCMGFIQKGDVTEACWRELLPETLIIITEKQFVEFNLDEMTGLEFKMQYIKSLTMLEWSSNIIIPLTMMFIEMPFAKDEEHLQVTYKLVSYIEKLTPQELPAFVYQILRFCQSQNSKLVFHKLREYFGLRIYSNQLNSGSSNSDSIISNGIDEELIQAESTVLYHIYQTAHLGHKSIKDYLSSLKNLIKSPEFILHPFQLTVLLTVSTVTFYEDTVFDLIRKSISGSYREELKKSECCWLRSLIPDTLKLEDVIMKIIHNSINERDLVIQGLVNLGFVLLGVGALLGRESLIAKKQWNLGKFILLNLVKEKHHIAHTILQRLCNHIIIGNNITQYVDCFQQFSLKFPFITSENKSCLIELMEALISVSEDCAEIILDIIIPLTKVSPSLRDHLILLLRKALYSRSTETRQIAVRGFLKILSKLKIQNLTALSQVHSSSSSNHSLLTQISLHRSGYNSQSNVFSNEALCLEVLNILKRCYMQQVDVRGKLYQGLNDAVNQNPDLALPVLNVLWSQFLNYYNFDENVLPPVDLSKLSTIRETNIIMQEPIGQLASAISFLFVKIQELEDEDINAGKFVDVFESVCRRLIKCELIHFELDDGIDLTDILPESKKKLATLKEAMCLYESLIGYKVWSWNRSSQSYAQQIIALFQGYFRLQHRAKNTTKSKKTEKKKKEMNKSSQENRTTQRGQTSQKRTTQGQAQTSQKRTTQGEAQTSQQDQENRQNESFVKSPKGVVIKLPTTILNFKVLIKFLNLLYENVNWTTAQQADHIKVKHDIHRHVMQATVSQLQQINTHKGLEKNKELYIYCSDIAKIIYPRCIQRLEEFLEFDVTTAVLAVDCFHIILNIVSNNYRDKLKTFLCTVSDTDNTSTLMTSLTLFIEKYEKLFKLDDAIMDDQEPKRMLEIIANTLTLLVSHIPNNIETNKHIDWMKTFATEHTVKTKNAAKLFAKLWFNTYVKFKSSFSIFEEVISDLQEVLGTLSDDTQSSNSLKIINELTVDTFIECLTNVIKLLLDNLDWMTNRLRSEYAVLIYAGDEIVERRKEKLANNERSVTCQLCLIISLVEELCNVKVSIGLSKTVIENVLLLFNSLNSLTKYFISRSSKFDLAFQNARFERAVKLAGRGLAPAWDKFILFIEQNQMEEIENVHAKKKNSSTLKNKVLKETKSIPKVVYEIEQFTKSIIQLSTQTKHDLSVYIGAGTTRDFRIKDIKSIMEKNKSVVDIPQSGNESSDLSTIHEIEENRDTTDEDTPPKKKSKS